MNQNLLVTKRDGSTERINLDKIHRVLDWAAEGLHNVSISQVELRSHIQFYDGIKTSDIHETIIKAAADLISRDAPDYQYLAARLAIFHLRKKAYGQFEPPALYDHVVKMVEMGKYDNHLLEDYTEEEFKQMDTFIDHDRAALTVLDIEKFANAAHAHGVPLIVDNTFATPVNCRPIEWGADIVTHSTTKYMDGHGATLGGAIVDGGKFDWMAHADKFPGLCTPDDSYHGITYAEHFGKEGAFITKATAQLMRDFGCVQSPINAYMLNLGLESLHVRMARHCENGQAVAEFLASHPKIAYVNYCGLPGDKYHAVAEKYLPNGSCGVVSFGVKGGREAAAAFMGHLKIAAIETHVADARTCCLHPASSTHRQMNDEQLIAAGVQPDLVRMSCGLEDKNDLIHDIAQALDQI